MNRIQFMTRLEQILIDIPEEERKEAIQYYQDYFEDAGPKKEAEVIRELGSPESVAKSIKINLRKEQGQSYEYGETGCKDRRMEEEAYVPGRHQGMQQDNQHPNNNSQTEKWFKIGLIAVLVIFVGIPFVLPIAIALLSTVFGLLVAFIAVLFGIVLTVAAIMISGIVLFAGGASLLVTAAAKGLMAMGIGLIMISVSAALLAVFVKLGMMCIPRFWHWLGNLCRKIVHKGKAV